MVEVTHIDNTTFNTVNDQTAGVDPLSFGSLVNNGCLEGAWLAILSQMLVSSQYKGNWVSVNRPCYMGDPVR